MPRTIAVLVAWAACIGAAAAAPLDSDLLARIDRFVESERAASGIPGVALAIVHEGRIEHLRGFGHDGRGAPIRADTPFPVGSLTKSFTALRVRQLIDDGRLAADDSVQKHLPGFRVADAQASARITLRHLLNQTSGFSRADGNAPLLHGSTASVQEQVRALAAVSLNRPVGERFEYSNLNFVVLAAVIEAVAGAPWAQQVQQRVLSPLAMGHTHVDAQAARRDGMTQVHQFVFGVPVARSFESPPAFVPTGGLVASAQDMARYLQMWLAAGRAPGGPIVSADAVRALLAPASPEAATTLLGTRFTFRYGEGWFVGPFGDAADARWHLGNLASFAAWMVLLPDTGQAVVLLVNANTEWPLGDVNAVVSRLPVGVVNLLRGQAPPQGPSLRAAYGRVNAIGLAALAAVGLIAWRAARARRPWAAAVLAGLAFALPAAAWAFGPGPALLWSFAPEAALGLGAAVVLLAAPFAWRVLRRVRP